MVHIVQCLCPRRHCLFAIAYESDGPAVTSDADALARARAQWRDATGSGVLNPWCGLCLSRDIRFEVGRTGFRTLDEAAPALRRLEAMQVLTGEILRARQARDN